MDPRAWVRIGAASLLSYTLWKLLNQLWQRRRRRRIIAYCVDIVPGWSELDETDFSQWRFIPLAGLSNTVVRCEVVGKDVDPPGVVVKEFGSTQFYSRETEKLVVKTLSDIGFGPRLLYEAPTWRVEGLLKGGPLSRKELADPCYAMATARLLGTFHQAKVNTGTEGDPVLFRNLVDWLQTALQLQAKQAALIKQQGTLPVSSFCIFRRVSKQKPFPADKFPRVAAIANFSSEIIWLRSILCALSSPIVLCHNDAQALNLLSDGQPHSLRLIDFEYANYNFRGFDLANTLCEMYIDNDAPHFPFFEIRVELIPSARVRLDYFRSYLASHRDCPPEQESTVCLQEVLDLQREVLPFLLASHAQWAIWSAIQALVRSLQAADLELPQQQCHGFGYLDYAEARFEEYFRLKELFSSERDLFFERNANYNSTS
eukprot:gb/GEZN01008294.1/.p1 GENE.gb/GEZN01008294.1/~~gb/GEZN01008294.1/.p1  ORF type:complete len:429 (-),score=54.50 gb/GEZN01008294.1/:80-1366(-)